MENIYPLLSPKLIFRQTKKDEKYRSKLVAIDSKEIKLNVASERVVVECDGGSSVREIALKLAPIFDKTAPETILSRLQSLLSTLRDQGVIEFLNEPVKGKRRRIIPKQPHGIYPFMSMFMEVTNACNLKCIHCYLGDIDARRELPLEDIKRVVDQYSDIGGEYLAISGGEPFVRKDLMEIVEYASSQPLFISILSNGILITDETAKKLSQYNIREVQISLDGAKSETHDAFRGMKGAQKAAIRAIEALRREGIKVNIATVVNRLNVNELAEIIDFCKQWDIVPGLSFQQAKGRAVKEGMPYQLTYHEHYREMIKAHRYMTEHTKDKPFTFKAPAEPNLNVHRCSAGLTSMSVLSNGDVYACLDLNAPGTKLGNIHEQSVGEIWNSDHPFLTMLRTSFLKDLTFCRDCRHFIYCKGGCPATAYEVWGNYHMPDPKNCAYFTMAQEYLTFEPGEETEDAEQTLIRCDK